MAQDEEVGAEIAAILGDGCLNLIGRTTLEQLIEELRKCQLLLTNDTGTMHLATLLGVPVVAVFGSSEPSLTGPLGKGKSDHQASGRMQPVFSAQMSARLSLHESSERERSGGGDS